MEIEATGSKIVPLDAAAERNRHALLWATSLAGSGLFLAAGVLAFGGIDGFVASPARVVAALVLIAVTAAGLASPVNLSSGEREDRGGRLVFVPAVAGGLIYAWLVPYLDHRDIWAVDGDTARWLGVAVFAIGGALRVWPMYVLGHRFSGLVAIQPQHELETRGPYRFVRHPSYLGMLLGFAGWALVFRSALGLLLLPLATFFVLERIAIEEELLASHFGAAYEEYRRRTPHLLPGVY